MGKMDGRIIDQELIDQIISEFRENIENASHHTLLLEKKSRRHRVCSCLISKFPRHKR